MDTLATILVGLGSGCIGSLVTTLLTPPIQHHFWKQQRRAELCLGLAKKTAKLIARFEEQWPRWKRDFLSSTTSVLDAAATLESRAQRNASEKAEIFYDCVAIDAEVRVLFSEQTWNEFAGLKTIILTHSSVGRDDTPFNLEAFATARNAAMRALYSEIGLAAPRATAK